MSGPARTGPAAAAHQQQGITPVVADLDARRPAVIDVASAADAVVHAARADPEQETAIVAGPTGALAGTGKAFVFLSGSGVMKQRTAGAWSPDIFAEDEAFVTEPLAGFRKDAEDAVLASAANGVRATVPNPCHGRQ